MAKAPMRVTAAALWAMACGCALLGAASAQPAEGSQDAPMPRIIPVPGLRPSGCPLPEPGARRLRTYPAPEADGTYAAYGDRGLLPLGMDVRVGTGLHEHGIDQLLFGAQTTFILPSTALLLDAPHPVEALTVPRRPMAALYGAEIKQGDAAGATAYRLPLTASVWEIAGRQRPRHAQPVTCLYFRKRSR